ncbi:16S rRNA m(7)G-527 methyltransferase [Desulfatibacillum alkenivorans DSM 16219]|jgi:16S rRNA (guanine527-N7)-methyltransferase|uniref:Ribosomal RNA small subunit methyltransferase G n=1 Tax=Desulfatibacillum alkenivorans DSM 16219 TaxID=1121393 RepID=A0A1M6D322_9BACT|nr:16S rRNA (guanine(527)-N(7))-methyltransferase RsmG [Desulfatibacillum alkenivorans]SHI67647.1 16S rRNA m(7)G-527 methyltransferase [Desulfatibacillum alkenivorans DSM 16219]
MTLIKPGDSQWRDLLSKGAKALGQAPDENALEKCAAFARLLAQANNRVNLTSIRDPQDMAVKHFADSLAPIPYLPEGAKVADIGSGAGFPGLVLAIFRPDLQVVSIETIRKKANFQRHAALELGLSNVKIYNIRAENWKTEGEKGLLFDAVVCRALSDLSAILSWACPMLAPKGRIIAMKGPKGAQELDELDKSPLNNPPLKARVEEYSLPIEKAKRSLVIFS